MRMRHTAICSLSHALRHFSKLSHKRRGPGSSVGIATELRAGPSGIESRWGRDFPLVQTGPGAHPASCTMGIGSSLGVEAAGAWGWPPPHLECRGPRKSRAIPLLTLRAFAVYKKGGNLPNLINDTIFGNKKFTKDTLSDNQIRELIAVKVLHTSLLNTTVVAFKVLPLGSYVPMPASSRPFKTILALVLWNGLQSCRCITPDVINVIKMPCFQYFLYLREQKKSHWGLDPVNR